MDFLLFFLIEIQLHITHFYRWESIKFYIEKLSDSLTRLKLQDILFNKQDNSSNYNIKKIRNILPRIINLKDIAKSFNLFQHFLPPLCDIRMLHF